MMEAPVPRRRPNFNQTARLLIRDVSRALPEFAHLRASRILVVAGEARRASRGTVKPLCFTGGRAIDSRGRRKPIVRVRGKRMLYLVTLRPLFFRDSTPEQRVATLLHELFHISPRFDGTLADSRRHAHLGKEFERLLRPLIKRYLEVCAPEVLHEVSFDGEVNVLHWLERPRASYVTGQRNVRRLFTEEQLFYAPVRMLTRRTRLRQRARRSGEVH